MNPGTSASAIVLGNETGEHVSVLVTRREFPEAFDYWDGNWVYATVRVRVGAFRAEYEALLRVDEFASFRAQLGDLHATLKGSATFDTMEHWLRMDVEADGLRTLPGQVRSVRPAWNRQHPALRSRFRSDRIAANARSVGQRPRGIPCQGKPRRLTGRKGPRRSRSPKQKSPEALTSRLLCSAGRAICERSR